MNSHCKRFILFCVASALTHPVAAYERATHAQITYNAIQLSGLNVANGNLLQNIGLDVQTQAIDVGTFGTNYFDMVALQPPLFPPDPASPAELIFTDFEYKIMKGQAKLPINFDLTFWFMCGVIREDDLPGDPSSPDANSDGTFIRVFNHFYDPVHNVPLSGTYITPAVTASNLIFLHQNVGAYAAPNWATGTVNSFAVPVVADATTPNHYTVNNAHEAMFRALTQQTQANLPVTDLVDESQTLTYNASYLMGLKNTRDTYWATTFRVLGDVLHLNQDMGQPQHTRNEPHNGLGPGFIQNNLSGHESVYESYVDARAQQALSFQLKYAYNKPISIAQGVPGPQLDYDNPAYPASPEYPVPPPATFPQYSGLWSGGGNGLADYSNAGFFTAANNANDHNFSSPSLGGTAPQTVTPTAWNGAPLTGPSLTVFEGSVPESPWSQLPAATGIPLTTYSVWDQFMLKQSQSPTYTLNRVNYDAMAGLLLPRSAAYSAGLINFFFRGQMAISLPHEGVYSILDQGAVYSANSSTNPQDRTQGFNTIKLQLENTTPTGEAMSGGTLTAVLKFHRNLNFVDNLTMEPGAPSGGGVVGLSTVEGPVEEVVVSTQTLDAYGNPLGTVAVPIVNATTSPIELEFDFARALPLGSTDISLQVVYRGQLGNEPDAVVVATSYISEPTYFTYMNAFDYIRIGTQVYTRDQINANPSLLAQVRPTTCVDNSVSPPVLSANCFPANQTLTITLDGRPVRSTPSSGNPLVVANNLPSQNYIRLALLTDGSLNSGQSVLQQSAIDGSGFPCLPTTAFTVSALNNGLFSQVTPASATGPASSSLVVYTDSLSKQRGILGWYITSCVNNGDGTVPTPTTPPDNRATAMSVLTGASIYPVQTHLTFPQRLSQ